MNAQKQSLGHAASMSSNSKPNYILRKALMIEKKYLRGSL